MIWTYRVFRDRNGRYSIREVYYEHDGQLINYGKNAVVPVSASLEELMQLVQWFREAFDAPVLSLEAAEAEVAARPVLVKKALSDRRQTLSFQEVLAQLAEAPDEATEDERQPALV